jgi:hypothetical protein
MNGDQGSEPGTGRGVAGAPRFVLDKWYADWVDGERVEVLYRANLTLGPILIGYAGRVTPGGRSERSFVAGGVPLPSCTDGDLHWPAAASGEALCWTGARPCPQVLWQRDRQLLTWDPLVLNGRIIGPGLSPSARGYAERLGLDFGPWRLGLERLLWGRYCGHRHSLVWIVWEGAHAQRLALLDGRRCELLSVAPERVEAGAAVLHLGPRQALVHESMAEGAVRGIPLPRRLAALRFLRGVESKWLAPGRLELDGAAVDAGQVIFEEVVWP